MPVTRTNKHIDNPAQLDAALGKVGVTIRPRVIQDVNRDTGEVVGTHIEYEVESNGGTKEELDAAINSYVHDPDFGKTPERKRLEALSKKPVLTAPEVTEAVQLLLKRI